MGGMMNSAGGFLGLTDGPQGPKGNFDNQALQQLQDQGHLAQDEGFNNNLSRIMGGQLSAQDYLSGAKGMGGGTTQAYNALAENPIIGSRMATSEVQNNPMLSGLYGENGAMNAMAKDLNSQVGQGWSLQPQDQTMYGQAAGQIARQYGQQGNQLANSLASRGLSSSGAAGAQFSGLAGNQNEQLANAQTQIMQQRFQNTMNQANQLNQMGLGAQQAIQQQAGRQMQGAAQQQGNLQQTAGLQNQANTAQTAAAQNAFNQTQANKPENFMDQSIANSNTASNAFAKGLGSMGAGAMGG